MKSTLDLSTSAHSRSAAFPFIERNLLTAKSLIGFFDWTEVVFGLNLERRSGWRELIKDQDWFSDTLIQDALVNFCRSKDEKERYEPFACLANRIIELGRGNIPEIPSEHSYPIDDQQFIIHAFKDVELIPEHGSFGAHRRPDIVGVRSAEAESIAREGGRARWTDFLYWFELKQTRSLIEPLQEARKQRSLPPLGVDGLPIEVRRVCHVV